MRPFSFSKFRTKVAATQDTQTAILFGGERRLKAHDRSAGGFKHIHDPRSNGEAGSPKCYDDPESESEARLQ